MGEMAGKIVVFILMFLCAAFVLGLWFESMWSQRKRFRPTSLEYRIANKIPAPFSSKRNTWLWLISTLIVSIVMWIWWLKDMGE
jgi:hypothetical protein